MLTFPDAAGFPAEQGTYTATFGTGPGMRPMPGLRVSGACPLPWTPSFPLGSAVRSRGKR
jgi:hypothetical protein